MTCTTLGNSVGAFLWVTGVSLFTAVPIILIAAAGYRNARLLDRRGVRVTGVYYDRMQPGWIYCTWDIAPGRRMSGRVAYDGPFLLSGAPIDLVYDPRKPKRVRWDGAVATRQGTASP
ncbi:hypothetical protein E1289_08245 [Actinomadura sp. 6K520]|nr:hypothetical protein E1289_08245 [Actinomadura sp. 6K520]